MDLFKFTWPHLTPHGWQKEVSRQLAGYLDGTTRAQPTQREPLYLNIVAANGSGKGSYIIAPFAVWFIACKVRARVIITSKSQKQIKEQNFQYIRQLCKAVEDAIGAAIFDIIDGKVTCTTTGSEIQCFVTNDENRGEGFHPFPDFPDAEMAVIIDEAKSIEEHLWTAFRRYTGYNYWIEISSPGPKEGHFFRTSTAATTILHPEPPRLGERHVRYVTAYDCPNIARAHIEQAAREEGINSAFFKSSILSEFTDLESENIIKLSVLESLDKNPPLIIDEADIGIGLDLAGGGDENCCYVRRGARLVNYLAFREVNTTLTPPAIDNFLADYKNSAYTFNADNGGISQAIVDGLVALGWRITRRNNQSPAANPTRYTNLGAEMYFHVKRLFERRLIPAPDAQEHAKLREQLTRRQTKSNASTQGKYALMSKREAKAQGIVSPDRADAFVLCYYSYRPDFQKSLAPEPSPEVFISKEDLARRFSRGFRFPSPPKTFGTPTILTGPTFHADPY